MNREKLSDKELVKKILEGNAQIFTLLISNTRNLVLSIVHKMINNPEDRKDLVQDVYLKVYKNLGSFKFNSKLSTWIGTIAYHACLNYLGKKKLPILNIREENEKDSLSAKDYQRLNISENQTEASLFNKDRARIIGIEIESLQPLYKTLICLYHHEELSYKEIAEITGLAEGTLKSYLYRARKTLKDKLLDKYKKEDL